MLPAASGTDPALRLCECLRRVTLLSVFNKSCIYTIQYDPQQSKQHKHKQMFPRIIRNIQCSLLPAPVFPLDPADETGAEHTLQIQSCRDHQQQNTNGHIRGRIYKLTNLIAFTHFNFFSFRSVQTPASRTTPAVRRKSKLPEHKQRSL